MGVLQRWGGGLSRRKRAALAAEAAAQQEAARLQAEEAARQQAEQAAAAAAQQEAARQQAAAAAAQQEAARQQAEQAAAQEAARKAAAEEAARKVAADEAARRQAEEAARQAVLQQRIEAAKVPASPINAPLNPPVPEYWRTSANPTVSSPSAFSPFSLTAPELTFALPGLEGLLPYRPFQTTPTNFFSSMVNPQVAGTPSTPAGTLSTVDPLAFQNQPVTYTGPVAFQPAPPVSPINTPLFPFRPLGS